MKTCIDCKREQKEENFPFDKSRNRYLSVCKSCTANRTEQYRQKHPDKWKKDNKLHFYSGGGIVAQSNSKNEFDEIAFKASNIRKWINFFKKD